MRQDRSGAVFFEVCIEALHIGEKAVDLLLRKALRQQRFDALDLFAELLTDLLRVVGEHDLFQPRVVADGFPPPSIACKTSLAVERRIWNSASISR